MDNWSRFPRVILLLALLTGLLAGVSAPALMNESASAAPMRLVAPGDVVISEFRTTGPNGASDEFVELHNPKNTPVDISGLLIKGSNSTGTSVSNRFQIPTATILQSGQYYLIAGSAYSGTIPADTATTLSPGTTDDGGFAITLADGTTVIDAVGMSIGSAYKEGTILTPLSGTAEQSYEREDFGCTDTGDNFNDFVWNQTTSDPQNMSSTPISCLRVVNVDATTADGTYTAGAVITINVYFSNNVDVTGAPTLLIETGTTDRTATYTSGSGSKILTFTYTVQAGDVSGDLDYVGTNALTLNGSTIIGAVGNADLTLPNQSPACPVTVPPTPCSLGANKNIVISNGSAPTLVSFELQKPATTPTNADTLTFRVTFNEAVVGVDNADFATTGITGTPTIGVNFISGLVYDVTISGGNLATLNGVVGLDLSSTQNITNNVLPLPGGEPPAPNDETYIVDNTSPTVSVEQKVGQSDPALGTPVSFTVTFNEIIDVTSFTTSDISTQTGIASSLITWKITQDLVDPKIFTLSATAISSNGFLQPSIAANKVTDVAGNGNAASTSADNRVDFQDADSPTVTIDQAVGQSDPASAFPIKFTVVFSEAVNAGIFTPSDITQNGTALGVTWGIVDSGDHTTFTVSALAATGFGTIIPSIAANRVTDLVGNNNLPSTSTDNTVTYMAVTPTPTRTLTPSRTPTVTGTLPTPTRTVSPTATATPTLGIIISEVAWMGTITSANDEWIELYNGGATPVNLSGWSLRSTDGVINIDFLATDPDHTIDPGEFFILAWDGAFTDVTINKIITASSTSSSITNKLNNNGQVLLLRDSSNTLIDTANSDGGLWPAGLASPTYSTMERHANTTLDTASNWYTFAGTPVKHDRGNALIKGTPGYTNWAVSVTATVTRTPTLTSVPTKRPPVFSTFVPLVGRPIINEILPRPNFDWNQDGKVDVFDEFIEIKNVGNADINIGGWILDDEENQGSSPFSLPSVTLRIGERIILYGLETNILLGDGGDTVRLINPNGKIYDAYTYPIAKVEDQSICRLPDGNGSWYEDCIPTPNRTNTREGSVPSMPDSGFESPVCDLPDTLPTDFLFAECRGYGAGIWHSFFWDKTGWQGDQYIPENMSKWESFVE